MVYEHKLSPAAAQSFKSAVEQLNGLRLEYLRALGLAKEAEQQSAALQSALGQQIAIIEQTDGLPAPVRPYALSQDCTRLVGEVPDRPAAVERPVSISGIGPAHEPEVLVNGADHA
jgi:hypothetical protein